MIYFILGFIAGLLTGLLVIATEIWLSARSRSFLEKTRQTLQQKGEIIEEDKSEENINSIISEDNE